MGNAYAVTKNWTNLILVTSTTQTKTTIMTQFTTIMTLQFIAEVVRFISVYGERHIMTRNNVIPILLIVNFKKYSNDKDNMTISVYTLQRI